ncbi:MAG: hypothetical protein KDC54_13585, partial [Lewinella sp.]|nr:hypothetical protein [Lewinella sp.]
MTSTSQVSDKRSEPYLRVLGIAQDAGYPQLGCAKACCARVHEGEQAPARVTCLGIVDPESGQCWLLDATPDLPSQWDELIRTSGATVAGILPTHAHIGHYTGLMYL